jgi:hypothetical protein
VLLAARQRVLAAVASQQERGVARRLCAVAAERAGAVWVTAEEVAAALSALPPAKAPGFDGLPLEAWRVCRGAWAPALARLFTAIGAEGRLPDGFLLGVVSAFPKAGDRADPANYRPITLLPAVYKVLAKVLAQRWGPVLAQSLGPEQHAFLPGRRLGDAVLFSQMLAAALAATDQPGAVVLLDIAKAYDTVCRTFLQGVMHVHGASIGMRRWVWLLLSDTRAWVQVQGHRSRVQRWAAGVRQGCPLSPLLYLFVAEALSCWLREQPGHLVGVLLAGVRYVSSHYADDTQVFLPNLLAATFSALLAALRLFADASGQRVNVPKSAVVPLGPQGAPPPPEVEGLPVRASAEALGVPLVPPVVQPVQRSRPGLRIEVRAGPPAARPPPGPDAAAQWEPQVAAVERACRRVAGLHLSAMGRAFAVSAYALSRSLHMAEFAQPSPRALQRMQIVAAQTVDGCLPRSGPEAPPPRPPGLSAPLLVGRVAAGGFGLLPLEQHVRARHAAWACRFVHSFCSPPPDRPVPPWVALAAVVLGRVCPALHPVQTLLTATVAAPGHACDGLLSACHEQRLRIPDGPLRRMAVALQTLGPLQWLPSGDVLPPVTAWLTTPLGDPAGVSLARRLAWRAGRPVCPAGQPPSVRVLTSLQLPDSVERDLHMQRFIVQASGPVPPDRLPPAVVALRATLRAVWRQPWDNRAKEVLWRLALNGVPGAGGGGRRHAGPCVCGTQPCADQRVQWGSAVHRQHAFWDCPVAHAVRDQLQQGLQQGGEEAVPAVAQRHLWLLQSPSAEVPPVLWWAVSLAALAAMEQGRRHLWALVSRQPPTPAAEAVAAAGQRAVGDFWLAVSRFARDSLPASALGVAVSQRPVFWTLVDGQLRARLPP